MVALYILGYLVCYILSYGLTFAYFQREFPVIAKDKVKADVFFSLIFSTLGPISLILSIILGGFFKHGIKYKLE